MHVLYSAISPTRGVCGVLLFGLEHAHLANPEYSQAVLVSRRMDDDRCGTEPIRVDLSEALVHQSKEESRSNQSKVESIGAEQSRANRSRSE